MQSHPVGLQDSFIICLWKELNKLLDFLRGESPQGKETSDYYS